MVDSNNSLALFVASLLPTSTNIRCRPDNSSVSGPNIGCNDVIIQSESFRAFNPSLSGVFNEPMSNISPDGFFSDNSDKIPADTSIGVATIITSKSIPASRQSEYECVSF